MKKQNVDCNVYIIRNTINSKVYVGQTWNTIEQRFSRHKRSKDSIKLHHAMNKYGSNNFYIELLVSCNDQRLADSLEKFWIISFNSIDNGYNIREGGLGGRLSEETKRKISKAHLGKKISQETKNKLSKINTGKIISQDIRDKLSIANSGANSHLYGKFGKDHPRFGYKHTEETKKILSDIQSGSNCHWYGIFGEDHPRFGKPGIKGELHKNSKITQEIADNIRKDYILLKSSRKVAIKYGVSQKTVMNIIHNKSWVNDAKK